MCSANSSWSILRTLPWPLATTWPDQKIYRGQLKDLAKIVHDNKLTLTTMLVVGEAIDNRQGLSELYSKHFTHLFRRGDNDAS